MKKSDSGFYKSFLAVVIAFAFTTACGKGGGILEYIPNLSNAWINKADATNTFFFLPAQTNTNKSTFDGNENPPGGAPQVQFTGSFENENIEFTHTSGAQIGKKYSGKIIRDSNPLRMELKSGSTTIVLERN